jgi:hypothetical protein
VSLFITEPLDATDPLILVFEMQTVHSDTYSVLNSTIGVATNHTPTQKPVTALKKPIPLCK